jgi:hypothetical protein
MRNCECCVHQARPNGGFKPISFLFRVALLYAALVVTGGTLMNTGHPVAAEAGGLIRQLTFVDPAISWADAKGLAGLAGGLRLMAGGIPIG